MISTSVYYLSYIYMVFAWYSLTNCTYFSHACCILYSTLLHLGGDAGGAYVAAASGIGGCSGSIGGGGASVTAPGSAGLVSIAGLNYSGYPGTLGYGGSAENSSSCSAAQYGGGGGGGYYGGGGGAYSGGGGGSSYSPYKAVYTPSYEQSNGYISFYGKI